MKFQIIMVIFLALGLVAIVHLIKKRSLELKYALSWLILTAALIIIVLVPGLLDTLADILGIYNIMNMVFFLGFCFTIIIIFTLTVALSRNSSRLRKLAQEIALSNKKIRDEERENVK